MAENDPTLKPMAGVVKDGVVYLKPPIDSLVMVIADHVIDGADVTYDESRDHSVVRPASNMLGGSSEDYNAHAVNFMEGFKEIFPNTKYIVIENDTVVTKEV